MAHKAGHKKVQQYKIYGLNQLYNGPIVKIGKEIYSTKGGTLEAFSQRLVPATGNINTPMDEPETGTSKLQGSARPPGSGGGNNQPPQDSPNNDDIFGPPKVLGTGGY